MILTNADQMLLKEWGESDSSILQIEDAAKAKNTLYTYFLAPSQTKKLSREEVIDLLGREAWLSGLRRSAFHRSATREVGTPTEYLSEPFQPFILFDSNNLFRR